MTDHSAPGLADWLTPARRKAAYAALAAITPILVTLGLIDTGTAARVLDVGGQILAALGLVMAFLHVDTSTASGMPAEDETRVGDAAAPGGLDTPPPLGDSELS